MTIANEKLSDIWLLQATFKENLFNLQIKVSEDSDTYRICEKLEEVGDDMKNSVTTVVRLLEEEKRKLHEIVGYIEEKCGAIERSIRDSARGVPSFNKKQAPASYNQQSPVREAPQIDTDELNRSLGFYFPFFILK